MSRQAERIGRRSQGFLEPGERIGRVVLAQGGISPWWQAVFFVAAVVAIRLAVGSAELAELSGVPWGIATGLIGAVASSAFFSRRVVLLTDRAVVVLEYGRFGPVKPRRVLARLPLGTGIGPLSGLWARTEVAGERLWVHRRWHGDAAAF